MLDAPKPIVPTPQSPAPDTAMPTIAFGPHRVSRLVLGANPINAGSHLSRFVNLQMKRYFTPERVQELLRACAAAGVNAFQSTAYNLPAVAEFRRAGGQMQFISLAHEQPDQPDPLPALVAGGTIGIAHHGEVTDHLFKLGQLDQIRPFLARIRATGVQVGISTHMPAVVDYVEAQGWDVDFYMACIYERHRSREELRAQLGAVPLPAREVYLEEDPPRMFAAIRRTRRPCLAFKILAAGRLCERQDAVEAAFQETFRQIKPNDAVIVGIYPEWEDQVRLDAEYVRRFSALSVAP